MLELNLALDELAGRSRPGDSVGSRHGARHAPHLPRRRAGRRQDVRDAQRGPAARRAAAPTSWSGSSRPTAGRTPQAQIGDLEVVPRRAIDLPRRRRSRRWTSTRCSRRKPERRAGRRARAHQRARLAQREALAGRRGAARRRHRRDLHRERAAPRVDERRRRADHRDQAAGDDPRRGGAGGRPDRARRHDAAGAAAADGARQHLPGGEGRRRRSPTTSARATSARCASSR